ncbi:MAG: ABC transporter ATP-binding protein, partial [Clostridia bacterium]
KDGKIDEKKLQGESEDDHFCPKCHMRFPDRDRKICPKCMEKAKLVKRLAVMFSKYKLYILMVLFTFVMIAALGVLTPYISNKVFYDEVLKEGGTMYGEIGKMILIIIAVRLVSLLISVINGIISAKVAAEVVYDLKKTIFSTIGRLSLKFFTNRQTGGLMTQINNDANRIYWFFCDGFPYLVTSIVQLISILVVMLCTNPLLTLYTFITVPLFFISYKFIFRIFEKLHSKAYSKTRYMNSLVADVLNGMRVVKSFSRENTEMERFAKRNIAEAEAQSEIGVTNNKFFRLLSYLMKFGSFVVWGVGGWQVMKHTGGMTYGTLTAFIAYVGLVYDPIDFLADVSNWWAECLNALQRLFEIGDATPDVKERENPITLEKVNGKVEFKNVVFSYEENRVVIDGITFDVEPGSTLGIVGHTGAGKSTLANLLTRLYDPVNGEILIDGINLRDIAFETLRKSIAIVSQETYLFRGTIMENIRYARPDASIEEVMAAAKIASAHQFIIKYPDGYQTMVGLGYKDLSGGEKQRISIARAVLKNPQILVLDEATAAMDTQTERSIQEALNNLTKNRTTIIIAHRLSTLRDADKLIVIENGKMPESGTVKELLQKKGVYYKLYKLQAEALKTIGIEE